MMPCLVCYATNTPSLTSSGLDSIYNTRHDVDILSTTPLRTSSHSEEIVVASDSHVGPGEHMANLPHALHRSIERLPLLRIDHLQIAPIPLHSTMEDSPRSLWFADELIVSCRGGAAGLACAYSQAWRLSCVVLMCSEPFRGGVFIVRHCHSISERSDAESRILLRILP